MFRRIMVPLDGSALAEQALGTASIIAARAGRSTSSIELVMVDTNARREPLACGGGHGSIEQRIYVNAVADEARRILDVAVTGAVIDGDPATAIVAHARETFADLIVMTTHGRTGLFRAVLGSVADRVVREAGIPVLIQRPARDRQWRTAVGRGFRRILVPLDGTDDAMTVILPVLDLCRWMEARPILARAVHPVVTMMFSDAGVPSHGVVDDEATRHVVQQAQDALTELALDIESDARIPVETAVETGGEIAHTLVGIARRRDADLIAMSTHARGASRIILGSVTDGILRATDLPLLLLHTLEPATAVEPGVASARRGGPIP